jgi:hypothetical protein
MEFFPDKLKLQEEIQAYTLDGYIIIMGNSEPYPRFHLYGYLKYQH